MKNFIKTHRYALFLMIFFVIFLPMTIFLPAQTDNRAIVTGISIDKKDGKYNVALQLITPQSNISNNENLQIVEDEGESVYGCIKSLGIKLGKFVGLEHANILIIGEGLKDDDLMNVFEYFYRNSKITLSTIVVFTDKEAKKLLETSAELNNNSSSSLQNNLGFNTGAIETSQVATLGSFYNDYFSFSSLARVPIIEVKTDKDQSDSSGGQSSSGGQEGEDLFTGQSSGSQSGSDSSGVKVEPLVQNNGESALFKKGKYVAKISKELTNGFSWLDKDTSKGVISLKGVTDNKYFKNADINVKVESSKTKMKYEIKDNKLICNATLNLKCKIAEVVTNEQKTKTLMKSLENYLTPILKEEIRKEVEGTIMESHNYARTNKLDVINFYDKFYKYDLKGLRKVLTIYGENYLDVVEMNLKTTVEPYK